VKTKIKHILVVDDVPERITDIEQEVTFSFPWSKIKVRGAGSLREAERAFAECTKGFDLVLLDLMLPEDPDIPLQGGDEGGLYLLRRFASKFPHTVFVLSSGSHSPNELPSIQLPPNFPKQNFHCVPKTAARSALLQILQEMAGPVAAVA